MPSLLKSTILGLALLGGVAATAHAQSVSALPPTGPATAPPAATAPAYSSTTKIYPNPGNNGAWQEEHYQATPSYDADKAQHPYSTSIGPQPGNQSSLQGERYQATDTDKEPGRHPYTAGMGPKPN
jgi:hypothetical protein